MKYNYSLRRNVKLCMFVLRASRMTMCNLWIFLHKAHITVTLFNKKNAIKVTKEKSH